MEDLIRDVMVYRQLPSTMEPSALIEHVRNRHNPYFLDHWSTVSDNLNVPDWQDEVLLRFLAYGVKIVGIILNAEILAQVWEQNVLDRAYLEVNFYNLADGLCFHDVRHTAVIMGPTMMQLAVFEEGPSCISFVFRANQPGHRNEYIALSALQHVLTPQIKDQIRTILEQVDT